MDTHPGGARRHGRSAGRESHRGGQATWRWPRLRRVGDELGPGLPGWLRPGLLRAPQSRRRRHRVLASGLAAVDVHRAAVRRDQPRPLSPVRRPLPVVSEQSPARRAGDTRPRERIAPAVGGGDRGVRSGRRHDDRGRSRPRRPRGSHGAVLAIRRPSARPVSRDRVRRWAPGARHRRQRWEWSARDCRPTARPPRRRRLRRPGLVGSAGRSRPQVVVPRTVAGDRRRRRGRSPDDRPELRRPGPARRAPQRGVPVHPLSALRLAVCPRGRRPSGVRARRGFHPPPQVTRRR